MLSFRTPALMPSAELWRAAGQRVVAANRPDAAVDEQAERAVSWLATVSPYDLLLTSSLFSTRFQQ